MTTELTGTILTELERLAPVRPQGKGWRARCPNPEHEDRHPSFFLYPGGGGRFFSKCGRYWSPWELAELLHLEVRSAREGLTVAELAKAKGLPEEYLRSLGVAGGFVGSGENRAPCVDIPYTDEAGELSGVHKRLGLHTTPRFMWRRGDHTTLYGLSSLERIRRAGFVILVEGESDAWTLWYNGLPALALPGADTWRRGFVPLFDSIVTYLWHERDAGGDGLAKTVSVDLPELRVIAAADDAKDPSELYLHDPEHFMDRLKALMRTARSASDLEAETSAAEARTSFVEAQSLLESSDILAHLDSALHAAGYAGDTRPAIIAFVGITSRLLDEPLNIAYISQSAAGKNAAIDAVLPAFPDDAYYTVRACSPRALIYNDHVFCHRTVVLTEADSLPDDGPAASAMRSLMSDRQMSYEVVEKGDDGKHIIRRIDKPGPTGLITTSTRPLGEQASTRVLSVCIPDTPDQTRLVLHAQADRSNGAIRGCDFGPFVALQQWLVLAGERRVVIPFAHHLAEAMSVTAVRMRRDFGQLLTVIRTIAILHQRQRDRDHRGYIVATPNDYRQARWLLEEVFMTTVQEGITPAVRETVEAVARLSVDGWPVSEQQLAEDLGLAKSTISYRVRRAIAGG